MTKLTGIILGFYPIGRDTPETSDHWNEIGLMFPDFHLLLEIWCFKIIFFFQSSSLLPSDVEFLIFVLLLISFESFILFTLFVCKMNTKLIFILYFWIPTPYRIFQISNAYWSWNDMLS